LFRKLLTLLFCSAVLCTPWAAHSADHRAEVRIAVLFTEDPLFFINTFAPTLDHLRKVLPQYKIVTKEISGHESPEDIKKEHFSFLISSAGFYASFDPSSAGLRQIATRHDARAKTASESIGSTIIALTDRSDLNQMEDLRKKRLVTRDIDSLSGWLGAKGKLADRISAKEDQPHLFSTKYSYPDVYSYLLSGEADAAVIPTCELENISNARLFKVIDEEKTSLSCKSSSPLYPDLVFSSFPDASPEVVKNFTVSLLTMPKMPDGASWGIANDFRSVLQLFKKLELGPYRPEPFSVGVFIKKYKTEVFLALALLLGVLFHIYRSNSLVFQRTAELREAIDQRDRVAEVARNSLKRLSQMEKRGILSQLSHMFAHELKQPLSTVVNYANGLKMYGEQKTFDPIVSQGIEAIASESSKAAQIVDRVREYAKSSRPVDSQSTTDLSQVTRKAIDAFRLYVSTQCRLQIDLPQKAEINGDPFELEILVLNLLRNAADAVEPLKDKALIKVSVASEDADWVLSIMDNGPPVPDEVLERMKKALQNSLKADGLGLGLKIVFAIAERHRVELKFSRVDPQGLRAEIHFKKVSQ
jgi:two-component system sensor histidine kinase TtrS